MWAWKSQVLYPLILLLQRHFSANIPHQRNRKIVQVRHAVFQVVRPGNHVNINPNSTTTTNCWHCCNIYCFIPRDSESNEALEAASSLTRAAAGRASLVTPRAPINTILLHVYC